jgi:hypothetical protein
MSWNKAIFDVQTQKITYAPMTAEEIAEAQAAQAEVEAREAENN